MSNAYNSKQLDLQRGLWLAVARQNDDFLEALLEIGANPRLKGCGDAMDKELHELTPLEYALAEGWDAGAAMMLRRIGMLI